MRTLYNSLKEITPKTKELRLKVIVVEKMMTHTTIYNPNKYQKLILADAKVRSKNNIYFSVYMVIFLFINNDSIWNKLMHNLSLSTQNYI